MERAEQQKKAKRIAAVLRARKRELGLQNKQIAERAGRAESTVSRILRGMNVPESDTLEDIGEALGLPWGMLMELLREPMPERDQMRKELDSIFNQLREDRQEYLLDSARGLLARQIRESEP